MVTVGDSEQVCVLLRIPSYIAVRVAVAARRSIVGGGEEWAVRPDFPAFCVPQPRKMVVWGIRPPDPPDPPEMVETLKF